MISAQAHTANEVRIDEVPSMESTYGIPADHIKVLNWVENLANTEITERAAAYDRDIKFPEADFDALWKHGLLTSNLPKKHGGLGFGIDCGEPLSFLLTIRNLAHGNSSTAHCYQVHSHMTQIIDFIGTDEQKKRYLDGTRTKGRLLAGVASEPGKVARGQFALQTRARRVSGGYVFSGFKNYATNATHADWVNVHVLLEGEDDPAKALLQLMVRTDAPGVTVDASVWNPVGMRACVSPSITFKEVFVPDVDLIGDVGKYFRSGWAAKSHLGFASMFLGSSQAMFRFAQSYLKERGTAKETYTQILLGEIESLINATEQLLITAANCWKRGDDARAAPLSNQVKIMAHRTVTEVLEKIPYLCGSSAMFPSHPLERYVRDMHVHLLHDRIEKACQMVGAAALGMEANFAIQR